MTRTRSAPQARGAPVAYTNRKGVTYYLCQSQARTGKPRYYFAREPQQQAPTAVPAGFTIRESVNGIVSLVRDRPSQIGAAERPTVEAAVRRHPQAHRYRVAVTHKQIDVYEQWGPDAAALANAFSEELGWPRSTLAVRLHDSVERTAQYTAVARFALADAATRIFKAERLLSVGPDEEWMPAGVGPLAALVQTVIPSLGTPQIDDLLPRGIAP